jgi:3',5'-cyclic-AMP phosphodiesterase
MIDAATRARPTATEDAGSTRRGFIRECLAWAGTGLVWGVSGGVLTSRALGQPASPGPSADFHFAQISDTHIGFSGEVNRDVRGTLAEAISRLNALEPRPALVLHTGDLTHAQKPGAFDMLAESLKGLRTERVFYVPGEHDVFADGGKEYLSRHGRGTQGQGWQSFDYRGVHFVGLVNVLAFKGEGMGSLGIEQIEWLERDLAGLSTSTPVVVFAHVPLWAVYPEWGWITGDGEQALARLRRFGSVTVLNGHIHQVMRKVEGHIAFHTAMSTAFPQPVPGAAAGPGPLKVAAEQAHRLLGVRDVSYVPGNGPLAVVDAGLG